MTAPPGHPGTGTTYDVIPGPTRDLRRRQRTAVTPETDVTSDYPCDSDIAGRHSAPQEGPEKLHRTPCVSRWGGVEIHLRRNPTNRSRKTSRDVTSGSAHGRRSGPIARRRDPKGVPQDERTGRRTSRSSGVVFPERTWGRTNSYLVRPRLMFHFHCASNDPVSDRRRTPSSTWRRAPHAAAEETSAGSRPWMSRDPSPTRLNGNGTVP